MPLYGPMAGYGTPGINPAANGPRRPFLWGRGGARMTSDDIVQKRRLAAAMLAQGADFSPVQHWTQGAARAATGLLGGLQMRAADNEAQELAERRDAVAAALASGQPMADGMDPIAAALATPGMEDFAELAYKRANPDPLEPVIQRANNGDILGLNPLTGEVMFTQVDPNPKPSLDWLSVKNADGTTSLIPVGVGGPITGAQQEGPQGTPPASLPPDFDFGEGGPGGVPSGAGFR